MVTVIRVVPLVEGKVKEMGERFRRGSVGAIGVPGVVACSGEVVVAAAAATGVDTGTPC